MAYVYLPLLPIYAIELNATQNTNEEISKSVNVSIFNQDSLDRRNLAKGQKSRMSKHINIE